MKRLEKYLLLTIFWCALYFFAFGFFHELTSIWVNDVNEDYYDSLSRIVGALFATIMSIGAQVEFTSEKTKKAEVQPKYKPEDVQAVFNLDTYKKWCKIHYPKYADQWLNRDQLQHLVRKYYEEFSFIESSYDFIDWVTYDHDKFMMDIQDDILNRSERSVDI